MDTFFVKLFRKKPHKLWNGGQWYERNTSTRYEAHRGYI